MTKPLDNQDKSKFDSYEVVEFTKTVADEDLNVAVGAYGIVLGMARCDDKTWIYSVNVGGNSLIFDSFNLKSTGRFVKEEDIYSGDSITVSSDGTVIDTNFADDE